MQGSKLYVGNLKYSVANKQLEELFSKHGQVKEVNIISGKGFGFVEMATPEEAQKAMDALNGTDFDGRTLRIGEAHPPKAKEGERRDFDGRRGGGGGDRRGGGGFNRF